MNGKGAIDLEQTDRKPKLDLAKDFPVGTMSNSKLADLKAALELWFDTHNLKQRSNLTVQQVAHIARAQMFADHYGSARMQSLVGTLLETAVSAPKQGGFGRQGLMEVVRFALMEKEETENRGIRKRLFGI